jgi:hypothetical protein
MMTAANIHYEIAERARATAAGGIGIDAMPNLYEIVEKLPEDAWRKLCRRAKYEVQTEPRRRPANVKQQVVERREFEDIRLVNEYVAEFRYRPGKCRRAYRVVVVWKNLEVHQGQKKLFDDSRCFFYITNDEELSTEEVVFAVTHAGKCCSDPVLVLV